MLTRTLGAVLCSSLTGLALWGAPALASTTNVAVAGGVSAAPAETWASGGSSSTASHPTKSSGSQTAKSSHISPVTSKTTDIAYHGPIYVRTATGEVIPYTSGSSDNATAASAGDKPELLVPGSLARFVNGLAAAPMSAPASVQQIIWAGNQIVGLPYIYGGGHASFNSSGYDCSGTVSFALHGGNVLSSPEDSSELMDFGSHGVGHWVTIFSNPEHAYMTVAGLRLDTSSANDPSNLQGPRWRPLRPENGGFTARHPGGL